MNHPAPIVLFCYNRPEHVRRTLMSLSSNPLASKSHLIVYSDGPATPRDVRAVNQVRNILLERRWCKTVSIHRSRNNIGLARSIIRGVTDVVNTYGSVIVLEDDLVLSKGFLSFMNDALNTYRSDTRVGAVSGYVFPTGHPTRGPFFLIGANCWGWATWKRSWALLESDPFEILWHVYKSNTMLRFDYGGYAGYLRNLRDVHEGKRKTWAILWYGSLFMHGLLGYHPEKSLVMNVGFDGSGSNCNVTSSFDTAVCDSTDVRRIPVRENKAVYTAMVAFYKRLYSGRTGTIRNSVKQVFHI